MRSPSLWGHSAPVRANCSADSLDSPVRDRRRSLLGGVAWRGHSGVAQVKDKQKCEDAFEKYCRNLERTNMWGGQHELLAERCQSSRDHPKSTPSTEYVRQALTERCSRPLPRSDTPCIAAYDMRATHATANSATRAICRRAPLLAFPATGSACRCMHGVLWCED